MTLNSDKYILQEYVAEFRQLETFFERNQLLAKETEQEAFNQSCHQKARNERKFDSLFILFIL